MRLGMTARKLEEVWVKFENYHGEMIWKRRKKKKRQKERGGRSERQIQRSVRGNNQLRKCKMGNICVIAAAQKTIAN